MCYIQAYILQTVSLSTVELTTVSNFAPNDVSKHQASVEENYVQQEEVRFLPAHPQILQICATPFNEHQILDLTSGNGFTDIDPPPPINTCLCRKEFRLHMMFGEQWRIISGWVSSFLERMPPDANRDSESRDRCCLFESHVSSDFISKTVQWDDTSSMMEVLAPNGLSLR